MKAILIDLEEFNIRFAKTRMSHAVSQMRWLWIQTALFSGLGMYFFITTLLGSSWFYLASTAIYWAGAVLFLKKFMPIHRKSINRYLRQIAGARIRLRRIIEMEEED